MGERDSNEPAREMDNSGGEGTLISHLIELRTRLLRMLYAVLIVFVVMAPFASEIFGWVAAP
ncbi:MAG: twin-arginine translocase subunit TatC, partial [Gammaproteobacteria bacterium]|nr:twin-arginine translocase subunit TatC [Gammaproteobacteria bacterium]